MRKKILPVLTAVSLFLFTAIGCGAQQDSGQFVTQTQESASLKTAPDTQKYVLKRADSLDEAVISRINERKKRITFYNLALGRHYTLSYRGINSIKDKNGEELAVSQLQVGDLVIDSFVKEEKQLRTIQLKKDAFVTSGISDYEINKTARTMRIDGKPYQLGKYVFVLANGKDAQLEDINPADVLKVSGTDRVVSSIVVEKGHGYIRLSGEEYFIGGWIEVGEDLIRPISEEMLLTVPEGEYDVTVTNKGIGGVKHVVVEANKEANVDLSDLKGSEVKEGKILFTLTPANAYLSIDGKEVDISSPVTLEYGIHQMELKAEGYKTMIKYMKVSSPLANINIEMEQGKDDVEAVSGNSVQRKNPAGGSASANNLSSDAGAQSGTQQPYTNKGSSFIGDEQEPDRQIEDSSQGSRVSIEAPKDAQLYLDGSYIGVTPASFAKVSGTHEVSLRREGYQTRSYTLYFDDGDNNLTYSLADLVEE